MVRYDSAREVLADFPLALKFELTGSRHIDAYGDLLPSLAAEHGATVTVFSPSVSGVDRHYPQATGARAVFPSGATFVVLQWEGGPELFLPFPHHGSPLPDDVPDAAALLVDHVNAVIVRTRGLDAREVRFSTLDRGTAAIARHLLRGAAVACLLRARPARLLDANDACFGGRLTVPAPGY